MYEIPSCRHADLVSLTKKIINGQKYSQRELVNIVIDEVQVILSFSENKIKTIPVVAHLLSF